MREDCSRGANATEVAEDGEPRIVRMACGARPVTPRAAAQVDVEGVPFRPLTLSGVLAWLDECVAGIGGRTYVQ